MRRPRLVDVKRCGLDAKPGTGRASFDGLGVEPPSPCRCASGREGKRLNRNVFVMTASKQPLRVGVGGPVGSGKTALMEQLCKRLCEKLDIAAITNDIYTKEDARILVEAGALPAERILGVETGGCPHTAIREDASINLAAVAEMRKRFQNLDLILIESGGDNSPPPSRPSSPTSPSMSSTSREARKSRARAAPASPARTSWSSTRPTSPHMSARR